MKKFISNRFSTLLKSRLKEQIPQVQSELKAILKEHGQKQVDIVRVDHIVNGMKELPLMFFPCSSLDPSEGIRFRGLSIPEVQERLPKIGSQPIPEAVFWLLLTGEIPSQTELLDLQNSITSPVHLPRSTTNLIKTYAKTHHPMTILSMCLLDLQHSSTFFQTYSSGNLKKSDFWLYTFDDAIACLKMLPKIAGLIYTEKFHKQAVNLTNQDWAGQLANYLGYDNQEMSEVLRGYIAIHTDHEGGNISAHSAYVASSALCDSYLSLCNAVNGLAGPLHGLANQEVLKFLLKMQQAIAKAGLHEKAPSDSSVQKFIEQFIREWLKTSVVPGYGHGRLRTTDPRYTHLKSLSLELLSDKYLVQLVHACEGITTKILNEMGKVKNPNPNVDAHSGVLLYELGLKEFDFYTVVFAVSRAMGCLANTILARGIGLPLERPGSMTLEQLKEFVNKNQF